MPFHSMNPEYTPYLAFLEGHALDTFDVIHFYKHFKFTDRSTAEKIFGKCIGVLKRQEDSVELRKWASAIAAADFEVRYSQTAKSVM